jgi:hypothetical protein
LALPQKITFNQQFNQRCILHTNCVYKLMCDRKLISIELDSGVSVTLLVKLKPKRMKDYLVQQYSVTYYMAAPIKSLISYHVLFTLFFLHMK